MAYVRGEETMKIKYYCSKCKKYVLLRQVCFSENTPNTHIKCEGYIILEIKEIEK